MSFNYCLIEFGVLWGRVGDVQECLLIVLLSNKYIKQRLKENKECGNEEKLRKR